MGDELHAWRDGQHVAVFARTRRGVELRYDDAAVAPLSLSMPNGGPITARRPGTWLEGLLPENPSLRAMIAREHGTTVDAFDLLTHVGADVAGAISLLPAGREPGDERDAPAQVSVDELRRAIAVIRAGHGVPDVVVGSHMSLAGAQDKFSIAKIADHWFLPTASQPSTHIIKPARARHVELDRYEAASLALARDIGLPAARADLIEGAFIVERFDRATTRAGTRRRHMEDLTQALGLPAGRKYAVSAKQAIELLREHTSHEQVMGFIARLAFNTHLGNADAHAKNYSLFLDTDRPELTPLYDTVPLAAFPHYDQQLAMRIGGARRAAEVTTHHWAKLARTSGLDPDEVTTLAQRIAHDIRTHAEAHGLAAHVEDATRQVTTGAAQTTGHATTGALPVATPQPPAAPTHTAPSFPGAIPPGPAGGVWVAAHVRNGRAVRGYWRSR